MSLAEKKCDACVNAERSLNESEYAPLLAQIKGWNIDDKRHLQKSFKTKDFKEALDLANQIGAIAEEEGHHPDLLVRWGELRIDMWTHKVDGLTEADFVLAAKVDRIRS